LIVDNDVFNMQFLAQQLSPHADQNCRDCNGTGIFYGNVAICPCIYGERLRRQHAVADWCVQAFGAQQASSLPQRGLRLAEEAIEAAQAAGTPAAILHTLIDHVYSRPVGDLGQELGGVGVTMLALAHAADKNADECEAAEVNRVLELPLEHFTRRNAEKNRLGFSARDEENNCARAPR
jgi:hypothetical protein